MVGTVKHIPGHGRALCDSHKQLPTVTASAEELELDIAPFRALAQAPVAMTAHIVYTAWDRENPATQSPFVIHEIVRQRIGFAGLLLSDDLDMEALSGTVPDRAERAIAAGCDLALNCWARMDDMVGIAERLPAIAAESRARLDRAMAWVADRRAQADQGTLIARRDSLLAYAGAAA